MTDDLHSIRHEPQLQPPPACPAPGHGGNEAERLRDSVASEAHLGGGVEAQRLAWFARERARSSALDDFLTHLAATGLGGLFAIAGAFLMHLMIPEKSDWGLLNLICFGPVGEELLKASGALYLVEKCPYRVHHGLHLTAVLAASALVFAVCENLLYVHVYVDAATLRDPFGFVLFRWVAPTGMHLACSAIASLGLIRVWRQQICSGRHVDLDAAYPFFATAMVLHGGYNLTVLLLDDLLFPLA